VKRHREGRDEGSENRDGVKKAREPKRRRDRSEGSGEEK
jgi:hypothetical protein